ncbi:hypothetical protein ABT235_12075 [Micromonospora echinofusca]
MVLTLAAATTLAGLLPARRATRDCPAAALGAATDHLRPVRQNFGVASP